MIVCKNYWGVWERGGGGGLDVCVFQFWGRGGGP